MNPYHSLANLESVELLFRYDFTLDSHDAGQVFESYPVLFDFRDDRL
jgi:hypothetical protein